MIEALIAVIQCALTGMFAGLTLWGMGFVGMIPMFGFAIEVKKNDEQE